MVNTDATNIIQVTSWSPSLQAGVIIFCAVLSIAFGLYNVHLILSIRVGGKNPTGYGDMEMASLNDAQAPDEPETEKVLERMNEIATLI